MTRSEYIKIFRYEPDKRTVNPATDEIMCPKCGKYTANIDRTYGICDCDKCVEKQNRFASANPCLFGGYPEFVTEDIKTQREKYFDDQLQPYRGDNVSREFVEAYPEEAKRYFTDKQIEESKPVWQDLKGKNNHKVKKSVDTVLKEKRSKKKPDTK